MSHGTFCLGGIPPNRSRRWSPCSPHRIRASAATTRTPTAGSTEAQAPNLGVPGSAGLSIAPRRCTSGNAHSPAWCPRCRGAGCSGLSERASATFSPWRESWVCGSASLFLRRKGKNEQLSYFMMCVKTGLLCSTSGNSFPSLKPRTLVGVLETGCAPRPGRGEPPPSPTHTHVDLRYRPGPAFPGLVSQRAQCEAVPSDVVTSPGWRGPRWAPCSLGGQVWPSPLSPRAAAGPSSWRRFSVLTSASAPHGDTSQSSPNAINRLCDFERLAV